MTGEHEDIYKRLKAIEDKLEIVDIVEYENLMHDSGFRPCDGRWDRRLGKCIEITHTPPVVDAGKDQIVNVGSAVQMIGTATDVENNIKTLTWSQLSGSAVTLSVSADGTTAKFTPANSGTYSFLFTAIDDENLKGEDDIVIKVLDAPTSFDVNAGIDQTLQSATFPVSTRLSGKITGNLSILDYGWTGLPNIEKRLNPTVSFGAEGEYELTLSATTVTGLTKSDSVKVKVVKIDTSQPVLNVVFPTSIEELQTGTIDATQSVADTVTTTQVTSKNINLTQDGSNWKWTFTPPATTSLTKAVSYQLGFKSEAKKGNNVTSKSMSISVTKSGGGGGDEFDAFGMKYLLKPTTKKVAMEKGSDHRNGQRYNVNHKFENHLMQGYYKLGQGQEKIETKEDGPNHGSCDFTTDQICFWWEAGLNLATGKGESQYEWPHADNYSIPDSKNDVIDTVGQLKAGNWVGWATAAYWGADGLRHYKAWCDPNPFANNDPNTKPLNNWKLVIHLRHTADLITNPKPITIPRDMQKVINYDRGFECEIRMHRGTNHDTEMKNAWVFEIVPPT